METCWRVGMTWDSRSLMDGLSVRADGSWKPEFNAEWKAEAGNGESLVAALRQLADDIEAHK